MNIQNRLLLPKGPAFSPGACWWQAFSSSKRQLGTGKLMMIYNDLWVTDDGLR
jgi:hypothetical protein